jgi:hypothetical protein
VEVSGVSFSAAPAMAPPPNLVHAGAHDPPWSPRPKASSRATRPTIVAPQTRTRRRRDGRRLPIR